MRVQTKLFLAMLPTALVLVFVGFFVSENMSLLSRHSEIILKDNFRSVLSVQRMMEAIERMDSAILFRFTGHASESLKLVMMYQPVFEENLKMAESNITEPGEQEAVQRLRDRWNLYQQVFREVTRFSNEQAVHEYHPRLYPLFMEIKQATEHILTLNQNAMVHKSEQVQTYARKINRFTFLVIVLASVIGIVVSIYLGRRTIRPLSILNQTVRRLGTGDLAARALISGSDEIAELATDFNDMADKLQQIQKSSFGELLLAQQASQAAIDSIPDPIIILDGERRLLNANTAAEADLELVLQQTDFMTSLQGKPEVRRVMETISRQVLAGHGPLLPKSLEEAILVPTRSGERYYLPRGTPLMDGGRVMGATVTFQDVTRLRRFDQMKNDLVSTVAHEFRTPLTSLRMAIHLLLEKRIGTLGEKQEDLLYAAREDCERLQSMVDDLLDVSRIHAGKTQMCRMETTVHALVEGVLEPHRLQGEKSGLELLAVIPPETICLQADIARIQLVLKNLLVNAIRHTPAGGKVELRVRYDETMIVFEVRDTGPGVPLEYQDKVFEKFFRVPGTAGVGTGLGLSIAKEIVEAHGGQIGLKSEPGKGSTFLFSLPRIPRPPSLPGQAI